MVLGAPSAGPCGLEIAAPQEDTGWYARCTAGLLHLEEELDLDGDVQGEGVGADGGAGVAAGLAKDLDEELARAVGDLRLVAVAVLAGDEAADADDLADLRERAELGLRRGEAVDRALPCALAGPVEGYDVGDAAGGEEGAIAHGDLAADVQEVAGAAGG